ncbi:MAG: lipid-binding SYLF domain-containing protein [Candidatus Omnitrophica bacterium]|nr:lipid-binding SYLF domain-containing protein [Candidatus Omnitrophota bacterium]
MSRYIRTFLSSAVFLFFTSSLAFSEADKWDNLLVESAKVFEEMTQMPEDGIPVSLLKDSYAVAIFPSTLSGGFIFGGQYGQGVVVVKGKDKKWGTPAVFTITGVSWGMQIGGQATDIILLIMNERGLDGLLQSKFKLGGDASVSAGPVGRDASAATDLTLKSGLLSYSRSRGAFIGLKLEGAVMAVSGDANSELYGKDLTSRSILLDGAVKPTKSAARLLKDLQKF